MLVILATLAMEALARPPVPGFVSGYEVSKGGTYMLEQIPSGETVKDWTRMITTQRFAEFAQKTDPDGFLQLMINGLEKGCPGAKIVYRRPIQSGAQMRIDCPLNPATGRPETFFAKALAGPADMHVAQVAFRRAPSATDVVWAEKYLAAAKLMP